MAIRSPSRPGTAKAGGDMFSAIGVNGLREFAGIVWEEPETRLRGPAGMVIFARMARSPLIAAGLHAIDTVIRGVEWEVAPAKGEEDAEPTDEAKEIAEWFREMLLDSPAFPWTDFVSEALSFCEFGYSLFELIYERRDDGRIGIADVQPRPQDSIASWVFDAKGVLQAAKQVDPAKGREAIIPIEKCLHFVLKPRKRNPEGSSLIRGAYSPWKRMERLKLVEDIGIERDLTGVPVMYMPAAALADETVKAAYAKLVRDVRFNEQAGVLLPSDPWRDEKGIPINGTRAYELTLLSSSNTRTVQLQPVLDRCEAEMGRLLLVDFLLLGGGKGAYALSKDKTDLFQRSVKALLACITGIVNPKLIGRVCALNGIDKELWPTLKPGDPSPEDLAALAAYVQTLSAAGAELFPDDGLENDLRRRGQLPAKRDGERQQRADLPEREDDEEP